MYNKIRVSVVVIGRNEGERLRACLQSVDSADWNGIPYEVHYVDSSSTDNSVAIAQSTGAHVIVLRDPSPCAAKARNLGWRAAVGEFVLFLDGDTCLAPGFVRQALAALSDDSVCAVWGHRRESAPQQSIYTKVLDLDWIYPAGRTLYFGGDVLVRHLALAQVDGFDPTLKAGEEPEMCARLRAQGWQIEHLDIAMTSHDLAVRTLKAYWLRCYRSGIAYAEVAHRMQTLGDALWQKEASRDFVHGALYVAYPLLLFVSALFAPYVAVALLAAAMLIIGRSAWRCRGKAQGNVWLSVQYAVHSHLQKIPALFGQLAWKRAQSRSVSLALVNYKD